MDSHPRKRSPRLITVLAVLVLALAAFLTVSLLARGPRRMVQQLGDRRLQVRDQAYRQLRGRGDWFATDALLRGLRSEKPSVRSRCALLLGEKKTERAFEPVAGMLDDVEPSVRLSAVKAVAQFGGKRSLDTLLPLLQDTDVLIQEAVMAALHGEKDPRVIAGLIDVMRQGDSRTKYQAAITLRNIGAPAVEPLVAALKTGDTALRVDILTMLGRMKDERAAPALKAMAQDPDPKVQRQAVVGLVYLGAPGVQALDGLLRNGSTEVSVQAANMLQYTDEPRAVDLLLRAVKDRRPAVRRAAATSLKWVPDRRRTDGLYVALRDRDAEVRLVALRGLENEMSDRMLDEMQRMWNGDPDPALRELSLNRLAEFNSPRATEVLRKLASQPSCPFPVLARLAAERDPLAIPPLLAQLRPPTPQDEEAAYVFTTSTRALAFMGEPARDALLAAIGDADPAVRAGAAYALGMSGDPRNLETVLDALRDPDPRVRRAAALGLEMHADVRAVPALLAALSDKDMPVRLAVTRALGATGDRRAVDPLLRLLCDRAPAMRATALSALKAFNEPRILDALEKLQQDYEPQVRIALAEGGAWANDPRGMAILAKLLPDRNKLVRDAASFTLRNLPGPQAASFIAPQIKSPNPEGRLAAVGALEERADPTAVDALAVALSDTDHEVRKLASQQLETLLTPEALPVALRAAESQDADTRAWAVRCLGAAGAPALEPLREYAEDLDPHVRAAAAHALAFLRDTRSVPLLVSLLEDEELDVRIEALGSLGVLKDKEGAKALLPFLESGHLHEVYTAAWSLSQIKDPRGIKPLAICMEDLSYRYSAMKALGQYPDREAIAELDNLLNTRRLKRIEKLELLELMGKHRDEYSLQVIVNYLNKYPSDEDAILGLGMRGETSVATPLLGYLHQRLYRHNPKLLSVTITAMGKLKERRAVPLLLQSLQDVNIMVAVASAKALGEIDDPKSADALLAALARGTLGRGYPDTELRQAAAEALGRMKHDAVRTRLRTALKADNWRLRAGAALAMGGMGEAWAQQPLKAALKDSQPQVREAAEKALEKLNRRSE
ncbi:MAG: HEAT repeat domain-containing protein [Armatimonadota bacterium]